MHHMDRTPFGSADCESEMRELRSGYCDLYFDETPFNSDALSPDTYLIIGRRGSGKTALAKSFSFQKILDNPIFIDIYGPPFFHGIQSGSLTSRSNDPTISIPRLQKIWEYVIWCVIFARTGTPHEITVALGDTAMATEAELIEVVMEHLSVRLRDFSEERLNKTIQSLTEDEHFREAQAAVIKAAGRRPIVITIDTLESYDVSNTDLMNAIAALVQCAANFNLEFSKRGVHLKVFMSGEVFPYLQESVLSNPLKSIRNPVFLLWRPKDLLRLISWRFFHYLKAQDLLRPESKGEIDWTNYREVMVKMWIPYFGEYLAPSNGLKEQTFTYVLRHTQMRPRQVILLCNAIARRAAEESRFPRVSQKDIIDAVSDLEGLLAAEILNSYRHTYAQVSDIVAALSGMPTIFQGNELDKRAKFTASSWPAGDYSPHQFRRLVTELGIVGRVRRKDEAAGYVEADFEYAMTERLSITHRDECAIHPMFYSRLNVVPTLKARVMPFSTKPGSDLEVETKSRSAVSLRHFLNDELLMKAVSGILQRSERQPDLRKISESFVDPGILAQITNLNDQIIYGRRGTGKTHVLKVLKSELDKDPGNAVLYLDARTLGSSSQFSDVDVPMKQRCLALFRDILGEIHNVLRSQIISRPTDSSNAALESLEQLGRVMTEPVSSFTIEGFTRRKLDKDSQKDSVGLSVDFQRGLNLNAGDESQHSVEEEKTTAYRADHQDKVIFPALNLLLQDVINYAETRLYVLIDEWSSIPLDVQPYLAEFTKRTLLPNTNIIVKIAALECRSNFGQRRAVGILGFELGSDISTSLDIDEYYVYDRNPALVTELFGNILFRHLKNELPERYLETNYEIYSGTGIATKLFSSKAEFAELVRAAEGVVRDLLNIFIKAFFAAQRRAKQYIDQPAIIEAARQWFEQDKARNLDASLRASLEKVIKEVVAVHRERSFFLPLELERHETIQRLFDARVLHLTKRGATYRLSPGVRYNVYTLDYGTYVDLLHTEAAPNMGFEVMNGMIPEDFAVPFDDNRALRLVILSESALT